MLLQLPFFLLISFFADSFSVIAFPVLAAIHIITDLGAGFFGDALFALFGEGASRSFHIVLDYS
jgi:hypothetical protein